MIARRKVSVFVVVSISALLLSLCAATTYAETQTIRLAKQFGIGYLPLTLVETDKLLEKHGRAQGLDLETEWVQFTGGTPMNEALISGRIDFASGGVGPLLMIWSKTGRNLGVKGVAALNSMPLYLNTINPAVTTLADFSDNDRIALPSVRTSIQAVTLQMVAEKAFGPGEHTRLDPLTVSMGHPDAHAAIMTGRSDITAHFGSAPYMYDQLRDPRVRKVVDSYDVLGGSHTFNLVWTTQSFRTGNPKVMAAFRAALDEAMARIAGNPAEVAEIWVKAEGSTMAPAEAEALIRRPENEWTTTPKKIMAYAEFMNRIGLIPGRPENWKEIFFEEAHDQPGS